MTGWGTVGSYNVIAVLDGQPAGMASGVPADGENGAAEPISMWVSPVARGRGVSDRLVRAVEDWARLPPPPPKPSSGSSVSTSGRARARR